ncbi:L-Proline/Glycine betaine transporter ProP [Acidisarcina polymorpha]|uniref:L-Proline/Glycine betaine transporter ProP n=1 Tax=Acidisarcina polymorpha TaxID=2211140 RepID=A0A2Z5G4D6_9BACT|nr:MFS transporter [Acidisarcina polymorpha]AXC13545.1 L-Proline/Glycine betaine transporter ProP [Acidisarcina polymorpha]
MLTAIQTERSVSKPWLFALASLGSALEFYDFVVFVFLTGVVATVYFPPTMPLWSRQVQSYALFAVGYFARPLGGIVLAHLGDIRGRKSTFQLSVLLMAIPTLLIAVLPTYKTIGVAAPLILMFLRIVQGIAIGGEAPAGWVYVAEQADDRRRGLAVGLLTSGLTVGIFFGSVVTTLLNRFFTPLQIEQGFWRLPFALGGVFGLTTVFLRRWLSETPVFKDLRARNALAKGVPLRTILSSCGGAFVRAVLLTWMLTAAIVVLLLMSPTLFHSLFELPIRMIQTGNLLATAALCLSTIMFGAAYDRFGTKRVASISIALFVLSSYALYLCAGHHPQYFIGLYGIAGLLAGCIIVAPLEMVGLFPPALRITGFAASYNIAYAVCGGVAPLAVAALTHYSSLAASDYIAVASSMGLVAVLTSGKTAHLAH